MFSRSEPTGACSGYWVLAKFTLTIGATFLLLLHQFTAVAGAVRRVSGSAAGTFPAAGLFGPQLVVDAGMAVIVLLAATTLSVYKPWSRTSYGRRKQLDPDSAALDDGTSLGLKIAILVACVAVIVFVVLHLVGGIKHAH